MTHKYTLEIADETHKRIHDELVADYPNERITEDRIMIRIEAILATDIYDAKPEHDGKIMVLKE